MPRCVPCLPCVSRLPPVFLNRYLFLQVTNLVFVNGLRVTKRRAKTANEDG